MKLMCSNTSSLNCELKSVANMLVWQASLHAIKGTELGNWKMLWEIEKMDHGNYELYSKAIYNYVIRQ